MAGLKKLTAENMADVFLQIARERYPTAEKIRKHSQSLGVKGNVAAEIAVYSAMRDGVRQVSVPHIFQTYERRDEVFKAIIELLEELEEELEAQEEEDEFDSLEDL